MAHSSLIGKIEQQARAILGPVDNVLLGLSGGADSVALLLVLKHLGISLHAVHCNFHLRGDESDRDMNFCVELARKMKFLWIWSILMFRLMNRNITSVRKWPAAS